MGWYVRCFFAGIGIFVASIPLDLDYGPYFLFLSGLCIFWLMATWDDA